MKRALIVLLGIACITMTSLIGFSLGSHETTSFLGDPETMSFVEITVTPSAWVSIPLPNGLKPEHFIDSNAPFAQVVANDGKIYTNPCFNDDRYWSEGEIVNGLGGSCGSSQGKILWHVNFPNPPEPSKKQSFCLVPGDVFFGPPGTPLTAPACLYLISDDGELLRWTTIAWTNSEKPLRWVPKATPETSFSFTACGGIMGLLLFILLVRLSKRSKQDRRI